MRQVASAVLALTLLAACASPPSPSARASTPPGLRAIASSYLELVATSNAATCTFNAVLSQSAPTLADLTRASADYASTLATLIAGLQTLDWPADIATHAQSVVDALATDETFTGAMAQAQTFEGFIAADEQLIEANKVSAAAAHQLRTDLGLESGGNPCST